VTLTLVCQFTVHGLPQPQGSKTIGRSARRTWVRESNPQLEPWRNAVAAAAHTAMAGTPPIAGPLLLSAVFWFPRPRSHYGTGRNVGTLKPSAPAYHTKVPDLDKLLRALGDAAKGIIWQDDSQIAMVTADKLYGSPGMRTTVYELTSVDRQQTRRAYSPQDDPSAERTVPSHRSRANRAPLRTPGGSRP